MKICATCGVEHDEAATACAICADDRQWIPATGQAWTTLGDLTAAGTTLTMAELAPGLHAITHSPRVGIGQQSMLVSTAEGNLLWEPAPFIDVATVHAIRELGPVLAVVASHPHMFGVQVEWARALDTRVLVHSDDAEWVARPDPTIETWSGVVDLGPGLRLLTLGGHFPGSAVAYLAPDAGTGRSGVLLSGDTMQANPDRKTVTFMRSYPNRIPLSAGVVRRICDGVADLDFDRLIDNRGSEVATDAAEAVQFSADRYIGWVSGAFDDLT